MSEPRMVAAQRAYDAQEPPEGAQVRVTPETTLGELDELIDQYGIRRVTIKAAWERLMVNVETRDADGDGFAPSSSADAIAIALSQALSHAVEEQRRHDVCEDDS